MAFVFRILVALIMLPVIVFHGLAPFVKLSSLVSENFYLMLAGADPIITAYVDTGWLPSLLLLASTLCLVGALVGVLKGERWAAGLVIMAAIADAVSLVAADRMGYTELPFSFMQIAGLGAGMVVLWLLVRGVTKRV